MTKYVGRSRVCGGMRRKDIAILGGQRLQYDGEQGTDMTHMNLGHRVFALLFDLSFFSFKRSLNFKSSNMQIISSEFNRVIESN